MRFRRIHLPDKHPGKEKSFRMANHVSSLKRSRQTTAKTAVNRANKTKLRGTLRTLREAIAAGDQKTLDGVYRQTASLLDKSVQKGVLHKNTASRYKSRLNARVKAVATKKAA
jgi:small subunit ribosomal protein S20